MRKWYTDVNNTTCTVEVGLARIKHGTERETTPVVALPKAVEAMIAADHRSVPTQ